MKSKLNAGAKTRKQKQIVKLLNKDLNAPAESFELSRISNGWLAKIAA